LFKLICACFGKRAAVCVTNLSEKLSNQHPLTGSLSSVFDKFNFLPLSWKLVVMWSLTWQKQKTLVVQKLAVLTNVVAMIALIIAKLLVAVTVAAATTAKTVVVKPTLCIVNGFLGHFPRGYQRNNSQ